MFTTLGLLAAGMTATSALLGWLDPSTPLDMSLTEAQLHHVLQSVVADGVAIRPGHWQDIDVRTSAMALGSENGRFLVATATRPAFHFHIDAGGRPYRSPQWQRQEDLAGIYGTIVVEVSPTGEARVSDAQWRTVHGLVGVLNGMESPPNGLAAHPVVGTFRAYADR